MFHMLENTEGIVDPDFPIFFKSRNQLCALDTALELNQLRSVSMMLNYIIAHQNNYIYSHLFHHCLVDLL